MFSPFYAILWLETAAGACLVDTVRYELTPGAHVFFLTPCQPYSFSLNAPADLVVVEFNTDFFCLERHQTEVGCNGVLFNNALSPPFLSLDAAGKDELAPLLDKLRNEMSMPHLAHRDLVLAYLKIFLIHATRRRLASRAAGTEASSEQELLQRLQALVEQQYRSGWKASDYARALHLAPSSLAAILRRTQHKSLNQMLQERLLIQAKRELYYVEEKTVKEIAYDLGFNDPSYFIRFFKKHTHLTPEAYRRRQYALNEA